MPVSCDSFVLFLSNDFFIISFITLLERNLSMHSAKPSIWIPDLHAAQRNFLKRPIPIATSIEIKNTEELPGRNVWVGILIDNMSVTYKSGL